MTADYARLVNLYGIDGPPAGLEAAFAHFCHDYRPAPLVDRAWLARLCDRWLPSSAQRARLFTALGDIEAEKDLLRLSHFYVSDLCNERHCFDLEDYSGLSIGQGMSDGDLYGFLVLLGCVPVGRARLSRRGIPKSRYWDTPEPAIKKHLAALAETGDGRVHYFAWQMNFYIGSIFPIGRFNFLPDHFSQPIEVYRSGYHTVAFFTRPVRVDRHGLRCAGNVADEMGFTTVFRRTKRMVWGHPIHPAGVVQRRLAGLDLKQWRCVLRGGNVVIGLHIPDGPGYTVYNLQSSLKEANTFFEQWFPELPIQAFGSESWLYDPRLPMLLGGQGNIADIQRHMYLYPLRDNGRDAKNALFAEGRPQDVEHPTRLQRQAAAFLKSGGQFSNGGMFILSEDIDDCIPSYARGHQYEDMWQCLGMALNGREEQQST